MKCAYVRCMDIEIIVWLKDLHISEITQFSPFTFYLLENHTRSCKICRGPIRTRTHDKRLTEKVMLLHMFMNWRLTKKINESVPILLIIMVIFFVMQLCATDRVRMGVSVWPMPATQDVAVRQDSPANIAK